MLVNVLETSLMEKNIIQQFNAIEDMKMAKDYYNFSYSYKQTIRNEVAFRS